MEYNFKELISGINKGDYKLIGSGSCRKVYDLNDGNVIKVAKDIRGIFQNCAENIVYQSRKSNFFAEVIATSEDNKCLIMQKAGKIKHINTVYKYYHVNNIDNLVKQNLLYQDIYNHKLGKGDLKRASSWGLINDVPVIIDYGLTRSIFKKFYGVKIFLKKHKMIHYSS